MQDRGAESKAQGRRIGPLLIIPVFVVGLIVGLFGAQHLRKQEARVSLKVIGADVSRAGGVTLFVAGRDGHLRQACNGICDDISYEFVSAEEYVVKIENISRKCIFCPGTYTTTGMHDRDLISGRDELKLTSDPLIIKSY